MTDKVFEIKQNFKKMRFDEFYRWLIKKYPNSKKRDELLALATLTGTGA